MKFQSALLSSAAGSISGATFTSFRNINVIRKKVGPRSHTSTFTQLRKQQQKLIVAQWQGLPEATRQMWQQIALIITKTNSFGQTYHPSGFNLFRERQFNYLITNNAGIVTPFPPGMFPTAHYVNETNNSTLYTIVKSPSTATSTTFLVLSVARQLSGYRDPASLSYRIAAISKPSVTGSRSVTAAYNSVYRSFDPSKYKYVRLYWVDGLTYARSVSQYLWAPPA